jgi:hypothetical protein
VSRRVEESNSLTRKLAQELDRAIAEAKSEDEATELERALARVHQAEDHIKRALGVA